MKLLRYSAIALAAGSVLMTGPGASMAAEAPAPVVVHIANFAFVPQSVSIAPGQSVNFVNDDSEAHTVTAADHSFDSRGLDAHDAWSHRFAKAGSFAYFCALHPYMKGTIVVKGTP